MQGEFEISLMGEPTYFLGLQIKKTNNETFIKHAKYFLDVLKKYEMNNAKPISTPMASNLLIEKDESGKEFEITKYQGMIRSFLYLITSTPNIMFNVCMYARFQASSR